MIFGNLEIKTHFDHPPIPYRDQDWSAWIDGQEEWKTGRGQTELEAMLDLHSQLVDDGVVPELKAIQSERESLAAKDREIAALQEENAVVKSLLQAAATGKAAAERRLAMVCKQRDALAEALRLVWSMFEDGRIVRNIANDGKPDWALKMLNFTRELQTIQAALASVDEQKQQEPTK